MDNYFLSVVALAALVVVYEKLRKPGLLPKAFKLGHWVYIFTIAFGVPWVIFGLGALISGAPFEVAGLIYIAGTIVWSAGWVFRWALRPEVSV